MISSLHNDESEDSQRILKSVNIRLSYGQK